jgi:hypothetical protein
MAQTGRISGPLLKENLLRQGKDLTFKNDNSSASLPLLFLDVNSQRIGLRTDAVSQDLVVDADSNTSDLIVSTELNLPEYSISQNTFERFGGDIVLSAKNSVRFGGLSNDSLFIKDNVIRTESSNSDIDLSPNQTGRVNFKSDTNVTENLYTPNNITLNGAITFGDSTTDTIDINSKIDSDIIPNQNDQFNLGSIDKRWDTIFTRLLNGQAVTVDDLSVDFLDIGFKPDNIFFVAENGDDTNFGNHIQAPFKTIKRAMQEAEQLSEPTTIYVYPGLYQEQFPITVPVATNIVGIDLRHVIVEPTEDTNTNDAFLLNGETTVENITVKNFYFDDNNGYAFRFAPGAVISEQSPYINNVSVITKGTVSSEDTKGYAAADAGRGAYIDGAELDSSTRYASMLFNSCTFITPGATAITMTNGVRIEWLSCFTYYAKIGLFAFNNSTGRVMSDGSVNFGAEIRSIASANIYGEFGAIADGDDCLMYLINHNFSYIGSKDNSDNDTTLVTEDTEVTEISNGRIVFTSIDQNGKYKVGNEFNVDFDTGNTSISGETIAADELAILTIIGDENTTTLDKNQISIPFITVSNNKIESTQGSLDFVSSGKINLNSNTLVEKDLSVSGDISLAGELIAFGNETNDTIDFNTPISQDFLPDEDVTYDLGKESSFWKANFVSNILLDNIDISSDSISTLRSNSNLELRGNAAGKIRFENIFLKNTTIATQTDSIILTSDQIDFSNNSKSIQLPIGSKTEYDVLVSKAAGDIRFNSDDMLFEGFVPERITFSNVYSSDRKTNLTVNQTNEILGTVDNTEVVKVDNTKLTATSLLVDDVLFGNNIVSNIIDQNLIFEKSSLSNFVLDNFILDSNTISKFNTDNFVISSTDFGYTKISGTSGVVVPVGDNTDRYLDPEIGDTRFNTTRELLETWDGTIWIDSAGTSRFVDEDEYNEILIELTLMFG